MKKILVLLLVVLLYGCTQDISSIKNEGHIGEDVRVRGTVEHTVKIGKLSGYTLNDGENTIGVSSEVLPKEGDTVTVKGVLI